jgi:precorrin-2/cobalt-factor-2 C20-methyltransferase
MKTGTLYGIGIGPGDPDLMTLKGADILSRCRNVFVPKARTAAESVALKIAGRHLGPDAEVIELVFPMTQDAAELEERWEESAGRVVETLEGGEDACFLTLGDSLLYSTYIYLLRAVKKRIPDLDAVTVPGITAFSAAAALTNFSIGERKEPVTIVPTADDLGAVERAIETGGTVILMKVGKRLAAILDLLERVGVIEESVFIARVGQEGERVETDLRKLRGESAEAGYLSIILVHANKEQL